MVEQIYQNLHAKVANLNCSLDLAVFQKIKTGGNDPRPLISRSTAHGRHLPPDGAEKRERERARGVAGEAPAGGDRRRRGLGSTEEVWGRAGI